MEKNFIWSLGDASIEFKDGSMQYHQEEVPAKSIKDVCYFYYDVLIKAGRRRLNFSTHDFPKIQNLHLYINEMINHDTKNNGYLLEDYHNSGFSRKVRYHQIEHSDMFWHEYFVRIEKYCHEVKPRSVDIPNEWTTYKMTIGEIPYNSKSDSCMAWFINDVSEEKLQELSQLSKDFVEYTIQQNNEWLKERPSEEELEAMEEELLNEK